MRRTQCVLPRHRARWCSLDFASRDSAFETSGNWCALSMPLRLHRFVPRAPTSATTRMPSHFGSIIQPSSAGRSPAGDASMGAGTRGIGARYASLRGRVDFFAADFFAAAFLTPRFALAARFS